jgi:hypothetical protein
MRAELGTHAWVRGWVCVWVGWLWRRAGGGPAGSEGRMDPDAEEQRFNAEREQEMVGPAMIMPPGLSLAY